MNTDKHICPDDTVNGSRCYGRSVSSVEELFRYAAADVSGWISESAARKSEQRRLKLSRRWRSRIMCSRPACAVRAATGIISSGGGKKPYRDPRGICDGLYASHQAEISQGILQEFLNTRPCSAESTGMDASNAGVCDLVTAAAKLSPCAATVNAMRPMSPQHRPERPRRYSHLTAHFPHRKASYPKPPARHPSGHRPWKWHPAVLPRPTGA